MSKLKLSLLVCVLGLPPLGAQVAPIYVFGDPSGPCTDQNLPHRWSLASSTDWYCSGTPGFWVQVSTSSLKGGTAGQFPYQSAPGVTAFRTPNAALGPVVQDAAGNVALNAAIPGGAPAGSLAVGGKYFGDGSGLTGLAGGGDMVAAGYITAGAGVPANPCATRGIQYWNTSTSPFNVYHCPSSGGNWLGPVAFGTATMAYPPAGVPNSTGSAWGTPYAVGTGANSLVQLDGSSRLPAVNASLLTNFPTLNQNTTGTAANVTDVVAPANGGSGVANTATEIRGSSTVNWAALGTGIVFHTTVTGAKRPAVYSDVVGLFGGGSCSGFLKNDGTCNTGGTGNVTVVGAGDLASTALMTGGGAQAAQTPFPTATLDASGVLSATGLTMPAGTPIEVVGACQAPASVATPAVNEYSLFLDSTNTCTLSRMSNARAVTVITGGTSTAGAPYTQSFTSQTTVALAHNLGLSPITAYNLQCFDGSGLAVEYGSAAATNLNTVTVKFAVAQTGSCTVLTGR